RPVLSAPSALGRQLHRSSGFRYRVRGTVRLANSARGWYGGKASPHASQVAASRWEAGGIAMNPIRSARGAFYAAALGLATAVACRLRDDTRPQVEPPPPGIRP